MSTKAYLVGCDYCVKWADTVGTIRHEDTCPTLRYEQLLTKYQAVVVRFEGALKAWKTGLPYPEGLPGRASQGNGENAVKETP